MPEKSPSSSKIGVVEKSQEERRLPKWLQSLGVGTEVKIDGREGSPTQLPYAFSSASKEFIPMNASLINIPSGIYTWMGEGWVDQKSRVNTKPGMRVAVLRKTYPYTRKNPRYYFILLEDD